jgi:hypothetical protein
MWIDGGTPVSSQTGIDNDAARMDYVRLGAVGSVDSGTRGTEYFDAFESRKENYIGPIQSGRTNSSSWLVFALEGLRSAFYSLFAGNHNQFAYIHPQSLLSTRP